LPGGSDGEFLLDDKTKSNFLCNLGYAAPDEGPHARRLDFEEFCRILLRFNWRRRGLDLHSIATGRKIR
jgi:hypothetical protein